MRLLDILDAHLSEAEMSALCRQFGVVFGAFPGGAKRDKMREFLGFIQRQGRMGGLTEATIALRPDLTEAIAGLYEDKEQELSWLDQVAGGIGQSLDSGLPGDGRHPQPVARLPSVHHQLLMREHS